jgi:hypothetical protein
MPFDVFISYAKTDEALADAACASLEELGIHCWIAPRDIPPGFEWPAAIVDAIDHCRCMVLIFSAQANSSKQVFREVDKAVRIGIPIITLRIENVAPTGSMEHFLRSLHWLDALPPPPEDHLGRLIDAVRRHLDLPQDSARGPSGQMRPMAIVSNANPAIQLSSSQLGRNIHSRRKLFLRPRSRSSLIAGAVSALVAVVVLVIPHNVRCGQTLVCGQAFIELNAASEAVRFVLGSPNFNELSALVNEAEIVQATKINLNGDVIGNNQIIAKSTGKASLTFRIPAFETASTKKSIVTIRHLADGPGRFEIMTLPEPMVVEVFSRDEGYELSDQVPKKGSSLNIRATTNAIRIGLTEDELLYRGPIGVSDLSFFDVGDPNAPYPVAVSTLKGASLRFADIYGKQDRVLAGGEPLTLRQVTGQIADIRMSQDGIRTTFSGNVKSAEIEWTNNAPLNLMPTVYERYAAEETAIGLAMIIAFVATLFVTFVANRREASVQ